jgi:hypothetical protein
MGVGSHVQLPFREKIGFKHDWIGSAGPRMGWSSLGNSNS